MIYSDKMSEVNESLIDTLLKVDTFDDLRAILPPNLTEKLGVGEKGVDRALGLLIGLAPFAPEPATFDRDAFNAVVAFDYESNVALTEEESKTMLEVALKAGLIKKAESKTERYMTNAGITPLVEKFFK